MLALPTFATLRLWLIVIGIVGALGTLAGCDLSRRWQSWSQERAAYRAISQALARKELQARRNATLAAERAEAINRLETRARALEESLSHVEDLPDPCRACVLPRDRRERLRQSIMGHANGARGATRPASR